MFIQLYPPLAIHEPGQREGNEDYIYPSMEELRDGVPTKLFVVCDGVGGAVKGEEASQLVCKTFALYFEGKDTLNEGEIEQALVYAERTMDSFVQQHPDANGMATTLAMLFLHVGGATVAHIGDSRVYQIRAGKIVFNTVDHSLVNELIASKVITENQALDHPMRNVVSRAIIGSKRPAEAEIALLTDIRTGDYFFLCTDGIIESFSNAKLLELFGRTDLSDEHKIAVIQETCQQNSRDNFSAFLLQVKSVENLQEQFVRSYSSHRKTVLIRPLIRRRR